MKPLLLKEQDSDSLQSLGRASVQIVHDLKNQLNGLKLYATFLRKRMEKGERPVDEMETVNKLIAGLDRAASDLSTLVEYGRPLELKKQPGVDVQKIMRAIAATFSEPARAGGGSTVFAISDIGALPLVGDFDATVLAEALRSISTAAVEMRRAEENRPVNVSMRCGAALDSEQMAIIEWNGLKNLGHDPFRSFVGGDGIRMSLAAKVIEGHGGSAEYEDGILRVRLPISS
jgi:signal transduction histidine kinase